MGGSEYLKPYGSERMEGIMEAQQKFDFDRAEQLGLLEQSVLPKRPGVSPAACKAVLKAIDNYGRGREAWPSCETLAVNTGLSVRTVKRALRVLGELSLIVVDRRGPLTLNHYRIVWSELALLVRRSAMVALPAVERSAMVSKRSAMVSKRSAMVALEPLEETLEEPPPPTTEQRAASGERRAESEEEEADLDFLISKADGYGLYSPAVVVDAAKRTSVEHVLAILKHYAASGNRYGPGALCTRLRRASPSRPPASGWPPPVDGDDPPRLSLASGLSPPDQRMRADLIQHGRRSGWTHKQIQAAVQRFEATHLAQDDPSTRTPCTA